MNMLFEARYALRKLKKTPVFATTTVLVVGISLAISMLVFAIAYRYWLKPLEFPGSDQWYAIQTEGVTDGVTNGIFSVDSYAWQEIEAQALTEFEHVSVFSTTSLVLSDGDASIPAVAFRLRPDIFSISNMQPHLGRALQADDALVGSQPVVMLSYETWQNYYNGDPTVIGKLTRLSGKLHTIVGVTSENFSFILGADFWLPLTPALIDDPSNSISVSPVVKLSPTATVEAAVAQLARVRAELVAQFPETYRNDIRFNLVPINIAPNAQGVPFYVMMALVALVLSLFSAINIGILLSARMFERQRELAIRSAVGSSRWRVMSQCLWENFILCGGGWLLGIIATLVIFAAVKPILESTVEANNGAFPERWRLRLDFAALLFSIIAVGFVWLLSSLAPVIRSLAHDIAKTLGSSAKGSGKSQGFFAASILVGCQTILACFLLILSGALVIALAAVINTDFGFATQNRFVANVNLQEYTDTAIQRRDYIDRLTDEVEDIIGDKQLAIISAIPGSGQQLVEFQVEDSVDPNGGDYPRQPLVSISNNFFDVADGALVAGRLFDETDIDDSLPVAIIDEGFAKTFWPTDNALGKRIQINPTGDSEWLTVVGITRHIRAAHQFTADNQFFIFRPLTQSVPTQFWLLGKSLEPLPSIRREIFAAAANANRDIPLNSLNTVDDFQYASLSGVDIVVALFITAALLTLLLAVSGIFGILARSITGSAPDIGVRRALGSGNGRILKAYLIKGMTFLAIGSVIGGGLAIVVNNALFSLMFSSTADYILPISAFIITALAVCIGCASYIPTKKIIAMEPGDALRYE